MLLISAAAFDNIWYNRLSGNIKGFRPQMSKEIRDYKFIAQLQALPYIEEIWLFGSRARNDNQERADIDLAILCPKATDVDWLKIMEIIEESDTLLKIDCIRFEKNHISNELYQNILKDKQVLYAKNKHQI